MNRDIVASSSRFAKGPHVKRYVLSLCLAFVASAAVRGQEWESMFNGKDLTGWEGSAHWTAKDGVLSGTITKDTLIKTNTFLIWKAGTVANFELKCKFRMDGGNSGIQYRSVHLDKDKADPYIVKGYQADMAVSTYTGILYEERGRGIVAEVGEKVELYPSTDKKKKMDKKVVGSLGSKILENFDIKQWHEYRIVAKGNHLQQFIDGKQTIDVIDHDKQARKMSGIVALQIHVGGPMLVQFKELMLKRLPEGGIIDP
jgi:hypothetical protein